LGGYLRDWRHREYLRGEITASQAMTRKALLSEARAAVEGHEIEKKIAELEEAVAQRDNFGHFRPKVVK
jgi:hypothetical protein